MSLNDAAILSLLVYCIKDDALTIPSAVSHIINEDVGESILEAAPVDVTPLTPQFVGGDDGISALGCGGIAKDGL